MTEEGRGSGKTTKQMIDAPKGAFFIWPNNDLYYPWALARALGREDLRIRGYSCERLRCFHGEKVVFDHAIREHQLNRRQMIEFNSLRDLLRARGKLHE